MTFLTTLLKRRLTCVVVVVVVLTTRGRRKASMAGHQRQIVTPGGMLLGLAVSVPVRERSEKS